MKKLTPVFVILATLALLLGCQTASDSEQTAAPGPDAAASTSPAAEPPAPSGGGPVWSLDAHFRDLARDLVARRDSATPPLPGEKHREYEPFERGAEAPHGPARRHRLDRRGMRQR